MLILAQNPDARSVAGYNTWRRLGRSVRKGERAIWIVAPLSSRVSGDSRELRGFRRVGVFDISQTDGSPLVEICVPLQGEDSEHHFARLVAVANGLGFEVVREKLPEGMFGDCTYRARRIRIALAASPVQAVKTLSHEIAHALLHEGFDDRALAELEAESAAYVVCQHLGVDSSDYSLGYVTTWAGGTESALGLIKASCGRITSAARSIIDQLDLIA